MQAKIILFSLFITLSLKGYNQTLLYNSKGQLFADTTCKLTAEQFDLWHHLEGEIIEEITFKIHYPELASENSISMSVIISFDIDSSKQIKNFKSVKIAGWGFEESIIISLKKSNYIKFLAPEDGRTFTFFIPFNFECHSSAEYLKKHNTIPILSVSPYPAPVR